MATSVRFSIQLSIINDEIELNLIEIKGEDGWNIGRRR